MVEVDGGEEGREQRQNNDVNHHVRSGLKRQLCLVKLVRNHAGQEGGNQPPKVVHKNNSRADGEQGTQGREH